MAEAGEVIPVEARDLAAEILASAQARGIRIKERFLRLEHGHPTLRLAVGDRPLRGCYVGLPADAKVARFGHAPDVITVHGSGDRTSRTWPRQRDGGFKIAAITDHLMRLAEIELSRPVPELVVRTGVPTGLSGLHVLHLAGVALGGFAAGTEPDILLKALERETRRRIDSKIARRSLIEMDLRLMAGPSWLSFGRINTIDHDPFELWSDRALQVLVLGRTSGSKVERRFVLVLDDHDLTEFTVADPAGAGLVKFTRDELTEAWKLGARKGVLWAGSIWVRRPEPVITRVASGTIH